MLDVIEYLRRPLTPDTTPADLDAFGADGWELCAITGGVGFFKRSVCARQAQEQADAHAAAAGGRKA